MAMSAKAEWCATSLAGACSPSISAARSSTTSSRIRAPGCIGRSTVAAALSWQAWTAATSSRSTRNCKPGQRKKTSPTPTPRRCSRKRSAAPLDIEIIAAVSLDRRHTLVAEKFQRGRIFLGGDAAHLFTPTGGLGYNTAVEDAVNLGWKLAAVLSGWGGPALLDTYETERQAIAERNTTYARRFADSMGLFVAPPELEDEGPAGEAARKLSRRPFQSSRPVRVQHSGHHVRRPLRRLADHRAGRAAPPPDAPNTYHADRVPGRTRAASRGSATADRSTTRSASS